MSNWSQTVKLSDPLASSVSPPNRPIPEPDPIHSNHFPIHHPIHYQPSITPLPNPNPGQNPMPSIPCQTYSDLELVARAIWTASNLTHSELLRRVNWRGIYAAQLRDLIRQLIQLGAITSTLEKPPWKRRRQVYRWIWGYP